MLNYIQFSLKLLSSDPWMLFDPSTPAREIFKYYTRNLRRFTSMIQNGQLDKLLQPGKFATEPPNNLEHILRYTKICSIISVYRDYSKERNMLSPIQV